jgi:hypothetical protein
MRLSRQADATRFAICEASKLTSLPADCGCIARSDETELICCYTTRKNMEDSESNSLRIGNDHEHVMEEVCGRGEGVNVPNVCTGLGVPRGETRPPHA